MNQWRQASCAWVAALVLWGAKGATAPLSGQVTSAGKPVQGAWVQLNTGVVAVTDARGRYILPNLPKATYSAQVLALGKQPLVLSRLVPGSQQGHADLVPSTESVGIVHLRTTTEAGEPCPTRVITRWRSGEGESWIAPSELTWACTLDFSGQPLRPTEEEWSWLGPSGACLWTQGEAVIALLPGQAELTCTAGPLMRAVQEVVEIQAGQITEASLTLPRSSNLRAVGWTCGVLGFHLTEGEGGMYAVNLPLVAAIARAEGLDWIVLAPGYGEDPAQGNPQQVANQVTDANFHVWLAQERDNRVLGGRLLWIGQPGAGLDNEPRDNAQRHPPRAVGIFRGPLSHDEKLPREFSADLAASPATLPVTDLALSTPEVSEHLQLWPLLVDQGVSAGCVSLGQGILAQGGLPTPDYTFVRISGELSLDSLVAGLATGATCASTGPVMSFSIGDALIGESLPATDTTYVAEMEAVLGGVPEGALARLELLREGEVVRTWDVTEPTSNHIQTRLAIREKTPTWYALRAVCADTRRIAITGPIRFTESSAHSPGLRQGRIGGE
ncbi:MAG: carboxypeptidase regulatory-like domain-containing protein [Candidatus Zipacnadales bacterium]